MSWAILGWTWQWIGRWSTRIWLEDTFVSLSNVTVILTWLRQHCNLHSTRRLQLLAFYLFFTDLLWPVVIPKCSQSSILIQELKQVIPHCVTSSWEWDWRRVYSWIILVILHTVSPSWAWRTILLSGIIGRERSRCTSNRILESSFSLSVSSDVHSALW